MVEELLDFEAIEKSRYENMSFAKRVVLCSFTEILYQRKLLPNEAFKAVRLKGIKLFVFDASHDDSYENLVKLSNICDEIENESVKTLRFLINFLDEGKERVGEVFEIHFAYGENITVSLKLGDSIEHFRYDSRTQKKDFQVFIMRLRQFCRMLRDLPEGSYGRYHVVYISGKKMRENGSEYFTKIVRAPIVWNGPRQDICGIVGKFNGKEMGLKMSVGTLFGTGATDSMALAEHLREENWEEGGGGWDEERENTQKRFDDTADNTRVIRNVSYKQDRLEEEHNEIVETYTKDSMDAFEWNDDLEGTTNQNVMSGEKKLRKTRRDNQTKKKVEKTIEKEKKKKEGETRKVKNIQKIEDNKKKKELEEKSVTSSEDGLSEGYSSNDSAQMGSDINSSTVKEMNEEANEKEGRMEMRRNRRRRMMEKKKDPNATQEEVVYPSGVSLADIEKIVEKTPGDSKSTDSAESIIKTPGVGVKMSVQSRFPE